MPGVSDGSSGAAKLTSRDATQVQKFCQSFRDLKSMGFAPELVTGALILHEGDVQAATDACLSVV